LDAAWCGLGGGGGGVGTGGATGAGGCGVGGGGVGGGGFACSTGAGCSTCNFTTLGGTGFGAGGMVIRKPSSNASITAADKTARPNRLGSDVLSQGEELDLLVKPSLKTAM
jgi:hypothetical protein